MKESIHTLHGQLALPAFIPDATRAVVRSADSVDLEEAHVPGLMVNTFHLSASPGTSAVASVGGIHSFMGWRRPVAADSGGFQVFSLLSENPALGSVTERGFVYRRAKGGEKQTLTPEKCIERQFRMGADIMFCLDYCTHPDAPASIQSESVRLTVEWARRCKETFLRQADQRRLGGFERPLLFAVVQGGDDRELRSVCAEQLAEIGFDGYGYGGWPIADDGRLVDGVGMVAELTPDGVPRHALGIGKPENVVRAAAMGYDTFDAVIPTRDARHKRLYVSCDGFASLTWKAEGFYENVYIHDARFARDRRPVEESCDCLCCRNYSRAYLRHLFDIRDSLALRLATIHNLRFYTRLVSRIREMLEEDRDGQEGGRG